MVSSSVLWLPDFLENRMMAGGDAFAASGRIKARFAQMCIFLQQSRVTMDKLSKKHKSHHGDDA
jgi:hypothetical protein